MSRRAVFGVLLTVIVGVISACGLHFLGFLLADANNGNGLLWDDNSLIVKFLSSLFTVTFSAAYFSRFGLPSRNVLASHFLALFVVLGFFVNLYLPIRSQQRQLLVKYQEFRQALLIEDYQKAYESMSPHWRERYSVNDVKLETDGFLDLGAEDSIYSVHINGNRAAIVPDPRTSWWFRPAVGESWGFERVGSEWYVSPRNINFYMPYSYILINWLN